MATKTKKMAKASKHQDPETIFRGVPLAFQLRDVIAQNRGGMHGANNQQTIDWAVQTALPDVVKALRAVGYGRDLGKTKNYRLPFDPRTIEALREASEELEVPMV